MVLGLAGGSASAASARHCWVIDPPGLPAGRWPGLLQHWERTPGGWTGWVTFAVVSPPGGQVIVQARVAAAHLRPL